MGRNAKQAEKVAKLDARAVASVSRALLERSKLKAELARDEVRRKIVLGSAGIEMLRGDDVLCRHVRAALEQHLSKYKKDEKLFEVSAKDLCADLQADGEDPSRLSFEQQARRREKLEKADVRRRIIFGGVFIDRMRHDASLRSRMMVALAEHFATRPDDARIFAMTESPNYIERLGTRKVESPERAESSQQESGKSGVKADTIAAASQIRPTAGSARTSNEGKPASQSAQGAAGGSA